MVVVRPVGTLGHGGPTLSHSLLQRPVPPPGGGSPPPQWLPPSSGVGGMLGQVQMQSQQALTAAPSGPAVVSCALDGLPCRYQLSEADVRETFQRWGPLQSAQIYREGAREVGVVIFVDRVDATDAQRQLNGHASTFEGGATASLVVILGPPEQLGGPPMPRHGGPPFVPSGQTLPQGAIAGQGATGPMVAGNNGAGGVCGNSGGPPTLPQPGPPPPHAAGQAPPSAGLAPGPAGAMPKSIAMAGATQIAGGASTAVGQLPPAGQALPSVIGHGGEAAACKGSGGVKGWNGLDAAAANGRHAWSCKIVVQAEKLHPGFPTAQKIVGVGNMNVEHIRTHTQCAMQLRGRSSGFLESDTGAESEEPLHLWLTADRPDIGNSGLEMAQDLLQSVYQEHQQWCAQHAPTFPSHIEPTIILSPGSAIVPTASAAALGAGVAAPLDASGGGSGCSGGTGLGGGGGGCGPSGAVVTTSPGSHTMQGLAAGSGPPGSIGSGAGPGACPGPGTLAPSIGTASLASPGQVLAGMSVVPPPGGIGPPVQAPPGIGPDAYGPAKGLGIIGKGGCPAGKPY